MRRNETLNDLCDYLAEALNISETMSGKAVRAYTSLGKWLEGNDEGGETNVYPQGSFALGTVVRPLSGDDNDYDIDLVCQLQGMALSPAREIKYLVGRRLKQNGAYAPKMQPEGKRCWTLEFDEFHVDVLPCTIELGKSDGSIRLTHRDPATSVYSDRYSNPKGYKAWFESRMGDALLVAKRRYSQSGKVVCSVDDVPTYAVKTPLQKAVQILKQHRNVTFADREDGPVSIIITTLAAHSYEGETGTHDALMGVLSRMNKFVEGASGCYRVPNPANPEENFAEKWNDDPHLAEAFFWWLQKVREDFGELGNASSLAVLGRELGAAVGGTIANRTMNKYGDSVRGQRDAGTLFFDAAGLSTATSSATRAVPAHQFYGA